MAKRFAALKRNASAGQAPQPDPALEKFAPDRFANGRADPRYSLDPGIRHYVLVLRSQGIETCQKDAYS
jgi:hypothetical protein